MSFEVNETPINQSGNGIHIIGRDDGYQRIIGIMIGSELYLFISINNLGIQYRGIYLLLFYI